VCPALAATYWIGSTDQLLVYETPQESLDRNIAAVFSQPDAKESNQRLTLTEFVNTMNKLVAKEAKEMSAKRG
jgi:hypothetical protein